MIFHVCQRVNVFGWMTSFDDGFIKFFPRIDMIMFIWVYQFWINFDHNCSWIFAFNDIFNANFWPWKYWYGFYNAGWINSNSLLDFFLFRFLTTLISWYEVLQRFEAFCRTNIFLQTFVIVMREIKIFFVKVILKRDTYSMLHVQFVISNW